MNSAERHAILLELPRDFTELLKKPMPIEKANFVGHCMASPKSYESQCRGGYYSAPSPTSVAEFALKKLDEAFEKSREIHEKNIPAIENNQKMIDLLSRVMEVAGIPPSYTSYEFPSRRHKTRKRITHTAGYVGDLFRTFPTNDDFTGAQSSYKRLKYDYDEFKRKAEIDEHNAKQAAERAQKEEEEKRKADIGLAKLIVKYDLPDTSDWSDVLEAIRDRNQYVDLAIAMEDTRGDWSEGFYRVENAIGRFSPKDERDKEIVADIQRCLSCEETDGRIFRDTEWSYGAIYSIVDKDVLQDVEACRERMDNYL